jgi:tetratricopeptide (TPR) repeat protein
MFAKEIVMTVPIALVMIEVLLLRRPWRRSALLLAPHIAFICLIPLRLLYIAEKVDRYKFDTTNIIGSSYPRYEYAVTQIRAVLSYIRLLVLPYNQNLDPDYPLYHSLLNPEIILSLTIWGCILMAGAGLLLRSKRETSTDLTGFSIFWFILSISISSSVVPQTDLMLEHHTYLPSLAFCTGSAAYLQHLMSGRSLLQQNAAIGGICLIILCFASLTVQRNQVYRSRLSVYSDTARKSPDKDRSNYALGNEYFEQFQFDQALPYLKKSLKINPENIQAYLSLGDSYRLMDRPLEAIALYNRYLETHPPQRKILMNLAWTYATSGKLPEAISTMQILLRITNNEAQMLAFVAELYLRAGNVREAQNYLEQAREADKFDTLIDMSLKLIQLEKMIQDSVAKNNANSF